MSGTNDVYLQAAAAGIVESVLRCDPDHAEWRTAIVKMAPYAVCQHQGTQPSNAAIAAACEATEICAGMSEHSTLPAFVEHRRENARRLVNEHWTKIETVAQQLQDQDAGDEPQPFDVLARRSRVAAYALV